MKWNVLIVVLLLAVAGGAAYYYFADNKAERVVPPGGDSDSVVDVSGDEAVEVIASDLTIPWEVVWLPDGLMLVTERLGRLTVIGDARASIDIEGVRHIGEGGLLGMAIHPEFASNRYIYLYFTTEQGGNLINRVVRYTFDNNRLFDPVVIVDNIPASRFHNGGRIAFGPDGLLYISTGDGGQGALAQDRRSLAGKILRVTADGGIPVDNPFGNFVYAYGFRNPQGLAWDDDSRLWVIDHGRSGLQSGFDELNLIKSGMNYGWPVIQGDRQRTGMESPVIHSGPSDTWAPAGIAYFNNGLVFTGLRGQALYRTQVTDGRVGQLERHYEEEFGRLRAVSVGPDGDLYITTSNRDGRGQPREGDDKIIRVKFNRATGSN